MRRFGEGKNEAKKINFTLEQAMNGQRWGSRGITLLFL